MNINTPSPETPGFLRRTRDSMYFAEQINKGNLSPDLVDKMVDFLLGFVTEPKDRKKAREELFELSQVEFTEILQAITGGNESETVPKANGNKSAAGT